VAKKEETIFGWTVERLSPRRVRLTNGDREITVKGGEDMEGDALVRAAINQAEAIQAPAPDGAHVIEVPLGTVKGDGKIPGEPAAFPESTFDSDQDGSEG
jgi:hypothetical protein